MMIRIKKRLPANPSGSRGQSLIETVLAIAIAIIVIVALVSLATFALRFSRSAYLRSQANKLANSGMELFRYQRDIAGLETLSEGHYLIDPNGVLADLPGGGYASIGGSLTPFERLMYVRDLGDDRRQVTVTVRWKEGADYRQIILSSYLSNWRRPEISP